MLLLTGNGGWRDVTPRLGILIAGGYGVMRGIQAWEEETRRLLYSLAGFVVCRVLGQLLVAVYSLGNPGEEIWLLSPVSVEAMAGWWGVVLGGLWPAAGQTLLRGGLGALLGLYLAGAVSLIWPDPGALAEELELGLLAIVAGASVIPLLSAISVRGMLRAVTALLPGVVLIQLFRLNLSPGNWLLFFRLSLLSVLLALPLAGLAHVRPLSSGTISLSVFGTNLSLSEVLQLARAGAVGAAFVSLVAGLTVLIGNWLTPLITRMLTTLLDLPAVETLLLSIGLIEIRIPVYACWIATLTVYASVFGVGRLARGGILYGLYRFMRFQVLLLMCCLVALLTEQALEVVLRDWPAFRAFGEYLLWMGYGLPVGAILLGVIFAIAYTRDRMPVFLIGLGFVLWLIQVFLLSGILTFVGGVVGLWASNLLGPFLDSQSPEGGYGMSWQQALPLASTYLGFFAGLGRALVKWLKGDLGMLVSEYRRVVQRYSILVDTRIDRLLRLREPWWAIAGFGAAAIWAMWQFVGVMTPALIPQF